MEEYNRGYTICHSTTTTNNLMMQTPSSRQFSFNRYVSLPREPPEELTPPSSKRPRGRPLGSKNKITESNVINENTNTESTMKVLFIEVPAGKDIIEALINLAHRHQASLTVLRGSGLITNVTLLQPVYHARTVSFRGPFHMTSLFGTYINANCGDHIPPRFVTNPICHPFSISVSGSGGKVLGGIVGGTIIAADVVLIKVALLNKPQFHRMVQINGNVHEIEECVESKSDNNDFIDVSNFRVMGASSTDQLNHQMVPRPLPTYADVIQRNNSTRTY